MRTAELPNLDNYGRMLEDVSRAIVYLPGPGAIARTRNLQGVARVAVWDAAGNGAFINPAGR